MDIQYLILLQNFREAIGGWLNDFLAFITTIAVDYYMAVPALILFWAVDKRRGAQVITTYGTALGVNATLKAAFCVYRPWIRSSEVKPLADVVSGATGYSFPSGHSSSSAGFYFGLSSAYKKYKGVLIFSIVMVALTMFSRNYVGVHTPQDVLVGCAVGVLAALGMNKVMDWVDKNPDKDIVVLLVAAGVVIAMLLYIYFKPYPMDYVDGKLLVDPKKMTVDGFKDPGVFFGTILGWFLERRFVKFDIEGSLYQKVMRCLVGGLLFVFFYSAVFGPLGKLISFGPVYFVLQAAQMVLFMTVYPILFKKWEMKKCVQEKESPALMEKEE